MAVLMEPSPVRTWMEGGRGRQAGELQVLGLHLGKFSPGCRGSCGPRGASRQGTEGDGGRRERLPCLGTNVSICSVAAQYGRRFLLCLEAARLSWARCLGSAEASSGRTWLLGPHVAESRARRRLVSPPGTLTSWGPHLYDLT